MLRKGDFIFTNRNHPPKAVMATVLGVLAWAAVVWAIYLTFQNGGQSTVRLGAAGLLSFLFAIAGIIMAVMSRMEKDKYYLFSYLGIGFNGTILGFLIFSHIL